MAKTNYRNNYKKKSSEEKKTAYEVIAERILQSISDGEAILPTRDRQPGSVFMPGNASLRPYGGSNPINIHLHPKTEEYMEKAKEKYGDELGLALGNKYVTFNFVKDHPEIFGEYAAKGKKTDLAIYTPGSEYWYYFDDENKRKGHKLKKDAEGKDIRPTREEIQSKGLHQGFSSKAIAVFNIMQFDLSEEYVNKVKKKIDELIKNPIEHMEYKTIREDVSQAMGVPIIERADIQDNVGGYYTRENDAITIRPAAVYEDEKHLMRIFFHEMTHATGSKDKLDRDSLKDYTTSKQVRAKEELIAEMGAAFLCDHFGIGTDKLGHDGYVGSWMGHLITEPKAVVEAVGEAMKASNLVIEKYENYYENKYGVNLKEQLSQGEINLDKKDCLENPESSKEKPKSKKSVGMAP